MLSVSSDQRPDIAKPLSAATAPILLLASTHFLMMADRHLPTLVLGDLKRAFDLSDTRLGLIQGPAFILLFVAATSLSAKWVDRLPRARFIAGAMVVWTIAGIGFGLAQSFEQLIGFRLLLGLAQAAVAPTGLSWITGASPSASLGQSVSVFTTGSALGRSGALLIGGLVLTAIGSVAWAGGLMPWRLLFLISAVPNLIVALALLRRPSPISAPLPTTPKGTWRAVLRQRPGLILSHIAASSAVVLVGQSASGWMPTTFQRLAELSVAQSGVVAGAIVLIGAPLGHLSGGALVDLARRRGVSPIWVCAVAVLGAIPAAALLNLGGSLAALVVGFLLITVFAGMAASAALGCFQLFLPPGTYGTANATFLATVSLVGIGFGPPLVGLLSDRVFGADGIGLAIFVAVAVFGVLAAALFLMARLFWARSEPSAPDAVHLTDA